MRISVILLTLTLLVMTPSAFAEYPGGAKVIEVDDEIPRVTFNPKLHTVSLFLESVRLAKESGWFTKEKEFALGIDVTIESKVQGKGTPDSYETSRVFKIDVSQFGKGALAIPLKSLKVFQGYDLSGKTPDNKNYVVRYINVTPKICRKKEATDFTKTLGAIFELSNKLPIPNNPYTEAANEVGAAIKNITTAQIQDSLNSSWFGEFGIDFMPTATESGPSKTRKTGATALIFGMAEDAQDKGRLDVNNLKKYKIKYNDAHTQLEVDGFPVSNDYLVFRTKANTNEFLADADPIESVKVLSENLGAFVKAGQKHGVDVKSLVKATPLINRYKTDDVNFELETADLEIIRKATKSTDEIQGIRIKGEER